MITLASSEICTGCMACQQICPMSCIQVKKDAAGNPYPCIDSASCIFCGKCQRSCPAMNAVGFRKTSKAYAVWSLDEQDRRSSTSGGAASVFYQTALEMGAWICGTEYTDDFRVIHTLTKSSETIARYKQSKYVFSDASEVYAPIQRQLKNGATVLFISLPCKVAGLLQYLGKKYENLITVDIVCHGTPSADRLKGHIDLVLRGKKADQLSFRNENEFGVTLSAGSEKIYQKMGRQDTYLAAFLEGIDYRPSCYQCLYARPERVSDLTICDFWGLGKETPWDHPYTGAISAVLINSDAGRRFFEKSRDRLFWEERPVDEVIKGNAQLNQPTPVHSRMDQFERICQESGFEEAVSVCLKDAIAADRKQLLRSNIRRNLRKAAGVFLKRNRG